MPSERVERLVAELDRDEKLSLVRGTADPAGVATGHLSGVDRLGIPPLDLVDGPLGVRAGTATAFPATVGLGAAWSPDLARRVGAAIAREARAKGQDVLLAPGVNLIRVPLGGRNFEYVAEDPVLAGTVGAGYVRGVENEGVAATVKHFVANEQERDRNRIDVDVGERALREVYLTPFRRAVDAGAGAVMAAYNRVDGEHATANERLLTDLLREEWGFEGVVVSDWWATHDERALTAGLDVEMPGISGLEWVAPTVPLAALVRRIDLSGRLGVDPPLIERLSDRLLRGSGQPDPFDHGHFGDPLRTAIERGEVDAEALDRAVVRVLSLYERVGVLDRDGDRSPVVDVRSNRTLAREAAVAGTTLLDEDGTLPLTPGRDGERLAVIGPNADRAKVGGGGSSEVDPAATVGPVAGLRERTEAPVTFTRGVEPIPEPSPFDLDLGLPRAPWRGGPSIGDAVTAAERADVAVVVVQDAATEGEDRETYGLPGDQDRLIEAVADVAPTVVVLRTGGPVATPWADEVAAVVETWYPGEADGGALADVLFGTDPGGRLPVTFGRALEDYPTVGEGRYPGAGGVVSYDEGVLVGHRGFDADDVEPRYPFGAGESYAAFAYRDLDVGPADGPPGTVTASVTVENVADRPGVEVVQAYVEPPAGGIERPPRELGAGERVELAAGESRRLSIPLAPESFAAYDGGWRRPGGEYTVAVGRSSRDLRLRAAVELAPIDRLDL